MIVVGIIIIFKIIFGIEMTTADIRNSLKKKLVVFSNNEIVISKSVNSDTIKVFINTYHPDTLHISTMERDSLIKDTLITDTLNRR